MLLDSLFCLIRILFFSASASRRSGDGITGSWPTGTRLRILHQNCRRANLLAGADVDARVLRKVVRHGADAAVDEGRPVEEQVAHRLLH
jgi:hypothetical protein